MSYDAKAHNGRIKNSNQWDLDKRRDAGLFKQFARLADTTPEMATIFIANFAYRHDYPLDDIERSKRNHIRWNKTKQSLGHMFAVDMQNVSNYCIEKRVSFEDLFAGAPAPILQLYLLGAISIETLAIVGTLNPGVFESWIKKKSMPLWQPELILAHKLPSFMKIDHDKFLTMYRNTKEEVEYQYEKV